MKYYSAQTGGFYDKVVHGVEGLPGDAVEVSEADWLQLLQLQSEGKRIVAGTDGRPVAVDHAPTKDELSRGMLARRARELTRTDGLIARHRDELEAGEKPTLPPKKYEALQRYRVHLRKLPQLPGFPHCTFPDAPA